MSSTVEVVASSRPSVVSVVTAGPAGPAGIDGRNGADGARGEDGAKGEDGRDGTDGIDGVTTEDVMGIVGESVAAAEVPIGCVVDFFGSLYGLPVPAGYQLCNGSAITAPESSLSGNTPNLVGFVSQGTSSSGSVGTAVGASEVVLTSGQIPAHTHEIQTPQATSSSEQHSHSVTPPATTTESDAHSHEILVNTAKKVKGTMDDDEDAVIRNDDPHAIVVANTEEDSHSHQFTIESFRSGTDSHEHTVDIDAFDSQPQHGDAANPVSVLQPTTNCFKIIRIF